MFERRRSFGLFMMTIGLCAAIASVVSTHFGILDFRGGTIGFLSKETIFHAGLGLAALGALRFGFDLGIFRDHRELRLDGLASYIVLAFAITATVGLVFGNLISASLFASGVGFLALLGIVALFGITFMGGFGTTGHRAQWRHGVGAAA